MNAFDRRVTPARPDLADERLRGAVPADRYVSARRARIAAPVAPVRRRPAADAPLDTEALLGEAVRVYDERDGFAWVQLEGDSYVGYVPGTALADEVPAPTHRVCAIRTFIYPGADLKLPPVAFLSLGAGVATAGPSERGYVGLATGGHVWAAHLAPLETSEPDYVATAERLVGVPYLWGGKSSLGIDCSALVQLSLAASGIAAPRDSDQQEVGIGQDISPDTPLRRGDLVFWKGHVGLMMDAERLLHANGYHMAVASEPLAAAIARIEASGGGPVTRRRRLPEAQRPAA